MTYRPVRERSVDQVVAAVTSGLSVMGYDEVSLNSLSTTDHSSCAEIIDRSECPPRRHGHLDFRSSAAPWTSSASIWPQAVAGEKKGGLTFAPEAGSQRMRNIINKNVTEEDLERATMPPSRPVGVASSCTS